MTTRAGLRVRETPARGLKTAWLDNESGADEMLFFIHGYLDTPDSWAAQAEAFGDKYRVLIPYERGVGPSEAPRDRRRYGAYSILLDHLEILRQADPSGRKKIHVVGHDVGGVHAWMLASHPDPRLASVVILNSAHPRQYLRRMLWPRQLFKSWYMGLFQAPYLAEAMLWIFHGPILKALAREGWKPPKGGLSLKGFQGAAVNAVNEYRQFVRDIPQFLRERSQPAQVPVLVISSEEDRYLEAPARPEFADIASDVTIRVVRGGHWIHSEQPERINRLLSDFWERHP